MAMVRAHGKRFNHQHPDFSDRHIVHSAAQQDGRMIVRISELFVLTASPSRPIRSRYRIALSNTPGSLTRPAHPSEGQRRASSRRADHAPVADRCTRILRPNLERSSLSCIGLLGACDKERLHVSETGAVRWTFFIGRNFCAAGLDRTKDDQGVRHVLFRADLHLVSPRSRRPAVVPDHCG